MMDGGEILAESEGRVLRHVLIDGQDYWVFDWGYMALYCDKDDWDMMVRVLFDAAEIVRLRQVKKGYK